MITFASLNWVAISITAIVYFFLGGLWFAPFLFGKSWHKAIGFVKPKGWKPSARYYVGPLLGCFVISTATAMLLSAFHIREIFDAASLGFIVGAGYAGSVSFINAITPTTPKPFLQGAIVSAYHIVGIMLSAVILVLL